MKLRGVASAANVAATDGEVVAGAGLVAMVADAVGATDAVAAGGPPEHAARSSALRTSPRIAFTDQAAKAA